MAKLSFFMFKERGRNNGRCKRLKKSARWGANLNPEYPVKKIIFKSAKMACLKEGL